MYRVKQVFMVVKANFRRWKNNPQIILAFLLGFVISFLLSNKVIDFAERFDTTLQMFESFIWTFGDAKSILMISLCLLLIFSDFPNLGNDVPLFLVRTTRFRWMLGQLIYVATATIIYVFFILISTCILSVNYSYPANLWSDTAAILGYSDIGRNVAIPSYVKVLERSFPYKCTMELMLLMMGYALLLSVIILFFNMCKKNMGMVAGVLFSGSGLMLNPTLISEWFDISPERMVDANIIFGWISPLNHATYYMHNFGYDNLPKLWMSYVFFATFILVFFILCLIKIRRYSFNFTGTQK